MRTLRVTEWIPRVTGVLWMLVGKDKNRWMKQYQGTARLEMQVEDVEEAEEGVSGRNLHVLRIETPRVC